MKKEIALEMNKYLANLGVAYIKLHNLHWNVVGINFKGVHEYLESLYDGVSESLDSVAELLKMHGEVPAASLKEYLELASIEEISSVELPGKDGLAIALKDLELLKAQAEAIRKAADAEDEYSVVGAMEDDLAQYSKAIWFIKAMLK